MEDKSRSLYSHEEYISLVLNSGSGLSHDYVSQSIEEDPRMMAFFDSLVRREIEGWSSDSDSDLSEEAIMQLHARGRLFTRTPSSAPAAASAADHHSDSENSSSSSLAAPDGSGGDEQTGEDGEDCPRSRRHSRNQSGLLVNEDSDSSEFWLDPMPRPRSPSPRENSTISSPTSSPSLPAEASTSSTSSSSSSSDDEERRSSVRCQNVMRRRRMRVVSRAGNPPRSSQALFSAIDSCSYPSISVNMSSSSSSGEEQNSLQIKPHTVSATEDDKCLSPSDFVCPSPVMSPGRQENEDGDRTQQDRHPTASSLLVGDHRTERPTLASDSPDSREANSSSIAADFQSRLSPGVNGQHRPRTPANPHVSSESEEETELPSEHTRSQRGNSVAPSTLKRTHVDSEEGESGSSPSEKRLKIQKPLSHLGKK